MTYSNKPKTIWAEGRSECPSPDIIVQTLGIVSRDYRKKFPNGYRDFSFALPKILEFLDNQRCDAAIFSLFSIIPRSDFNIMKVLAPLRHLRAVFVEEFTDERSRKAKRFLIYYRLNNDWHIYALRQKFGSVTGISPSCIIDFVANEMPRRNIGNCCVLLCGESNGVKYSREHNNIEDKFGLRENIPKDVSIVLNPIHDRMFRPEMPLKRKFLSQNGRWTISVWNKGKIVNRKTRDGKNPPWQIFHDGVKHVVASLPNEFGVEIGILDIASASAAT